MSKAKDLGWAWRSGQKVPKPTVKKKVYKPIKKGFYQSWDWMKVRFEVLKCYGPICMCRNSTENIVVDHIKPRIKFPHLALDLDNLQVLCRPCNMGKSNDDYTDFRPKAPEPELKGEDNAHMKAILQ